MVINMFRIIINQSKTLNKCHIQLSLFIVHHLDVLVQLTIDFSYKKSHVNSSSFWQKLTIPLKFNFSAKLDGVSAQAIKRMADAHHSSINDWLEIESEDTKDVGKKRVSHWITITLDENHSYITKKFKPRF